MSDIYDYLSFFFPCFSLTNIPCSSFSPCFWRHPRPDSWGIVLISNAPRADCHGPWQSGTVPGDSSAFSRPCGESAWPSGRLGGNDGQRGNFSHQKPDKPAKIPGGLKRTEVDFTWFYRLGIFAILLGIEPQMWPNFGGPIKGRMGVFFLHRFTYTMTRSGLYTAAFFSGHYWYPSAFLKCLNPEYAETYNICPCFANVRPRNCFVYTTTQAKHRWITLSTEYRWVCLKIAYPWVPLNPLADHHSPDYQR